MYEIRVESSFSALHRVRLADGTLEPLHGHDWRVVVVLREGHLDEFGMVADFEEIRASLRAITEELHHRDLNAHDWFERVAPTAECVAGVIFDRILRSATWGTKLVSVEVVEAPGCSAAYCRD